MHIMPKLPIPETPIPEHMDTLNMLIQRNTSESTTPSEFLEVMEGLKNNMVVANILSLWKDELQDKIKKLAYAKVVLTNEIYQEIGEQWITHPDMTLEKLCTIAMSDPLTERPDDWGLPIETVKLMTWEYLAHAWMTVDKITLIEMFGVWEDLTAQQIAEMPQAELDDILSSLFFG